MDSSFHNSTSGVTSNTDPAKQKHANAVKNDKLPQTGDMNSSGVTYLGAALLTAAALAGVKSKKKKDESK